MASLKKQITLCTLGTIFEWYDFSLFACLTPILSQIFFQNSNHVAALMATFAIFASGYVMRPLGAIFFGHLGDKLGRKYTLLITIFSMTIATTAIGLIPTGATFSTVLLVFFRLLQGFSTSGEYPGGLAILSEQTHAKRKSFISSLGVFGTGLGSFAGALFYVFLLHTLGEEQMRQWGWRIPFLLGAPLGIVGYYLRKHIYESPEFAELKNNNLTIESPIIELFRNHFKTLIATISVSILTNTFIYINFIYLGNYLLSIHKINAMQAMYLNLVVTFTYTMSILIFGFFSDFINKKRILMSACFLIVIFSYPLFSMVMYGTLSSQFFAQLMISLLIGMALGPFASILPEQFPTAIRYSGLSITLNFAASFFGGSAPILCGWLTHETGTPMYSALYIAIIAFLAFCGAFKLKFNY
jgi:MHS family proline/betaine transporter-like MFS transporter